jgi:hypothetical protein
MSNEPVVVDAHPWFECWPGLSLLPHKQPRPRDFGTTAVEKVWLAMNDGERHRLHRFTCEGDRSVGTIEVIYMMRAAINREEEDST